MPAPIPINQLTTLYGQQPKPWDQLSPLNKLAALFTTSAPDPSAPDRQTDLPFDMAFQQAATRHFAQPAQPTPWRDVVAALGNVAQMGIMGRGGFGMPPTRIRRVEEPNVTTTFNKPQGLYTTPAEYPSPHADLGGVSTTFTVSPQAKILHLPDYGKTVVMRRGADSAGAGVHAARHFLGPAEFSRLRHLGQKQLIIETEHLFPEVAWNRYFDTQEVMEGLGGMLARRAGFDAMWLPDKISPPFSEFVALQSSSVQRP